MRRLFTFPNPVNEISARLVAGGIVVFTLAILLTGQTWLVAVLFYGFLARVLTGPKLSPLGQFVTRVVTPRLPYPEKLVAGPPKRFAQGMGATMSGLAVLAYYGFGAVGLAQILVGMITVAATFESVFAYCFGCKVFGLLMKAGIIPESVCEECNNLALRRSDPVSV